MTKWKVKAQSFNMNTGKMLGPSRVEIIDTNANELFYGAEIASDVHRIYNSFWNDFPTIQREMVLVQKITKIKT